MVLKYFTSFSPAALVPLFASEYISSETSTLDKSVLLPSLYSRAGSGLTRISNLLPSAVRRTVVILVSTIYLVEEFYLKYIYAWIMEFITLFGELLVNIASGESISNADQLSSMPEILKKCPTICSQPVLVGWRAQGTKR